MQRSVADELVLIDADSAHAEGEMMDLNNGLAFVRPMRIIAGDYADLADADVIVLCTGIGQRPG
jgi:L-lactate dehydrogenase